MNLETIKREWDENGYVVVPQLMDAARTEEIRSICDRVLEQWISESTDAGRAANSTNMAFLTEPRFFQKNPESLKLFLNFIADEKILSIIAHILQAEPLFHNTQYFFNPASDTRGGDWHRDQQFGAPDEETEKVRMNRTVGIHAHIAFLPDDNLEFVTGSHARWDTPEELTIRKGLSGAKKNSSEMPNAHKIHLNAGDAVFFSAWGIHRGNYVAGVPRRTFDAIYGTPPDWEIHWYTPPPTCFLQKDLLDGLTPQAQNFFGRFIETYKDRWLRGNYDA
ncbi:MAG TPA: phytanoyl-CoA dioxygenase family protein [Pyrinomonadaceae bacterium]|nr:phytanoyl-CoA dioxygenase family protein [Pyrinomonadaceae bacterium]